LGTAALGLVLAAALIHAGWNAVAKRAGDPLALLWWAGALGTLLYLLPGLVVLTETGFPASAVPFVIATIVLHAVYFFALGRAYASGDLSLVYPIARGLGVTLVPFLAYAIFDERLSALGTLGVALVIAGIFSLHWRGRRRSTSLVAPGTGWAVVTGVLIACYSIVDKAGVARLHPLPYIGLMEVGACLALLPAVLRRREALRLEWRTNLLGIVLAAVMSPGGYLLVLFAFQLSKAAYVVAGREVSIVFSALIGRLWLKEEGGVQRVVGAAVVAAGVACVALAR
jgi:drug/metabolite transporter (DMT)-like permease